MTTALLTKEIAKLKSENDELRSEVQSLREFVSILSTLFSVPDHYQSDDELMPFLRDTLLKMMRLVNAPDGSLAIVDEETKELVFIIVHGEVAEQLTGYRIPMDEGIMGWVVQNRQTALVRDVRRDQRFSHLVDETFKFRTQSIIAAPLIGGDKVYGVIEVLNQPGHMPFSDTDVDLLKLLCRAAGEALAYIERKTPQEE